LRNPFLTFSSSDQIEDDSTSHIYEWKRVGVLRSDVDTFQTHGKVAMIECSLQEAIKIHHNQAFENQFNYIYLRPPSVEELGNRLIRSVKAHESASSIKVK